MGGMNPNFSTAARKGDPEDEPAREIPLARGEIASVEAFGVVGVECLSGRVWITHEGDPRDLILTAGQRAQTRGRGRWVAEAFEPALLRLCREPQTAPKPFRRKDPRLALHI
jgi:hypothetical protein